MELEIFRDLQETLTGKKNEIEKNIEDFNAKSQGVCHSEEIDLARKLDAIEEYSVDRFEGEYVVLENRRTNEIRNVRRNLLPKNVKEGSVLQYMNGKYLYNAERTQDEANRIQDKMNKLWK